MRFHLLTQAADELVRNHEDDDLGSSDGLADVWDRTLVIRGKQLEAWSWSWSWVSWLLVRLEPGEQKTHHVPGQFVARQVFDVLVLGVDDVGQLAPGDGFFVDPHVDLGVEAVRRFHVVADDLGDGRTPEGDETSEELLNQPVMKTRRLRKQDVTSERRGVIPGEARTTKSVLFKVT